MTFEQHAQRIRQLEFELHKADYGMGMPRDYQRVCELHDLILAERLAWLRACVAADKAQAAEWVS